MRAAGTSWPSRGSSSEDLRDSRSGPALVSLCRSGPALVSLCRSVPALVSLCRSVPALVSLCRSVPALVSLGRSGPALVSLCPVPWVWACDEQDAAKPLLHCYLCPYHGHGCSHRWLLQPLWPGQGRLPPPLVIMTKTENNSSRNKA